MLVFDRLSSEAINATTISASPSARDGAVAGPEGATPYITLHGPGDTQTDVHVTYSQLDAFHILSDLCLLTAGTGSGLWHATGDKDKERVQPVILKLGSLQRTFGLELIESILSGYEESVKQVCHV